MSFLCFHLLMFHAVLPLSSFPNDNFRFPIPGLMFGLVASVMFSASLS